MIERGKTMIEAVIFDWAGTTVDYGCFAPVRAFIEAFNSIGISVTVAEVREPMGALKRTHIKQMLAMPRIKNEFEQIYGRSSTDQDIDNLLGEFTAKLMEELSSHTALKPHVLEVVNELHRRGIKIGSTTGYTSAMLAPVVISGLEQGYSPDAIVTPDDTNGVGRPSPLMLEKNLQQLGVHDLDKVIKVGDTVSDIEEGKNAGVYSIGVIEGSSVMGITEEEYASLSVEKREQEIIRVKKIFEAAGADQVIMNFSELIACIQQRQ